MLCAHPAIPPGEIEAEIPGAALMMHVMMRDGRQPPNTGIRAQLRGKTSYPQCAKRVFEDHDGQHDIERQTVGRDQHQGERHVHIFDHGFAGREIVCGERCRIVRAMMLHMGAFIELGRMHRPVRPIEIGVVQDDQERDRDPEPEHAIVREIIILLEQTNIGRLKDKNVHRDEDTNRLERALQLHLNLLGDRGVGLRIFRVSMNLWRNTHKTKKVTSVPMA